ncbi:MAG TPA: hypothetical protein EYG80_06220 [Flavobacteriaceae bacterium]|nr:hypothetical protein [Flavobacteriaceae bacterium]
MKFEYIKKKLINLRSKVEIDNSIGHFDINKEVEDVYLHLLNNIYGWNLKNANLLKENFPAIDLIDDTEKIVIQVTSTTDTTKLGGTIEKFKKLKEYSYGYKLKMFYIKDIPNFQKKSLDEFKKDSIEKKDLLGIKNILSMVQSDIDICEKVYETLKKLSIDDSSKNQIIINVNGDVKGVVNAESGSVINQTIS